MRHERGEHFGFVGLARLRGHALPALLAVSVGLPTSAFAQSADVRDERVINRATRVINVARGLSALVVQPSELERVSVTNSEIAEAVVISPTELLINGKAYGETSLIVWRADGGRRLYTVEVTADGDGIRRRIREAFPDEDVSVSVQGETVFLAGRVPNPAIAGRIRALVEALGLTVDDARLQAADEQILLRVRFAEVSHQALRSLGPSELRALDLIEPDVAQAGLQSISDGLVRLFLLDEGPTLELLIRALEERSVFRTLAEPNLLVLSGEEASFLAGGEFPFPVVQSGDTDAVTIQFKEFGVRLNFLPVITPEGAIRMEVTPEVSSLDFASGLSVSGFRVPTLRTRRASTHVALDPGQHLAIAGLLSSTIDETESGIPLLGDIPIIGTFFRSDREQQERTELLVLITPELIEPSDTPPPIPPGEPELWDWDEWLRELVRPDFGSDW